MKLKDFFANVIDYRVISEKWVRNYFKSVGFNPEYTFVADLATADWFGEDNVNDTYKKFKEEWLSDYKAFTEVVMSINLMAWFHDQLRKEGVDDRDDIIDLYNELYWKSRNDFYDKWGDNEEACDYFFITTD